ncbi:hypothetical protein pb186bvf_017981 [Paramecium bursaria]
MIKVLPQKLLNRNYQEELQYPKNIITIEHDLNKILSQHIIFQYQNLFVYQAQNLQ